jgi:uncharacterized protein YyaL (SSP411 family)
MRNGFLRAKGIADYAILHYYDKASGMFYYTADDDEHLIARKYEIMDGVIPASNSVMARNLKKLGLFFDQEEYLDISAQMLRNIVPHLAKYSTAIATGWPFARRALRYLRGSHHRR